MRSSTWMLQYAIICLIEFLFVQRTTAPPLNICPVGWNDDGNGCLGVLEGVPPLECHPGLRLVGDKCIGELVRPAISVALQTPACDTNKY